MSADLPSGQPTDVQRMLADSVASFIGRDSDMTRVRSWRGRAPGFDRAVWADMAALGLTGLLVPEQAGGSGLELADMAVVAEQLGAALSPEPLIPCAVLAVRTLAGCDDAEQGGVLLAQIASGETLASVAFQECAGDLQGQGKTTVDMHGQSASPELISLNGEKQFVMGAAGADGFVVSASASEASAADQVLAWVPADTPGVSLTPQVMADGRLTGTLRLDAVRIPASNIIARGNHATSILNRALDEATVMVCAEMLGLMGAALHMTLEYLRTRNQFGRAIGSFQSLQHRSVDLFIQQKLSRASLADALSALARAPQDAATVAAVSRAKARCNDAAALITRQAIQMHGAIGYTEDSDVGLFAKRALTLSAWLGNSAFHRRRFLQMSAASDN